MNPGSPAPQASVLIQQSVKQLSDTGIQARPRARTEGRFAKEISVIPPYIEKTIADTQLMLKGDGLTEYTVNHIGWLLRKIARNCDITNPETVKQYIATAKTQKTEEPLQNETKNRYAYAYDKYCEKQNIVWKKPYYKVEEKTPLIPTTENVNAIINTATTRYAVIFRILTETGAEGKELENVSQSDIDAEQGLISIRGHKGHASGTYKLKTQTAEMLRIYLHKNPQEHPFPHSDVIGEVWQQTRRRAIKKLCNPALSKIMLKSLRNYSGAQLYYKLPDPIAVMRHLRHKKLETTMHYIRGITIDGEEEYICKVATTPEEAMKLIETGFIKQDEFNGQHLYRKRK